MFLDPTNSSGNHAPDVCPWLKRLSVELPSMRPIVHVSASLAGGALLGALTGSWWAAGWSLVGGVLVDLDHVPEYFLTPRLRSVPDFFAFWKHFAEQRLYIVLHDVELVLLLGLAALLGWAPALTGGLAFGLAHHLLLDRWGNEVRWSGYFFSARLWRGFSSKQLLVPERRAEQTGK